MSETAEIKKAPSGATEKHGKDTNNFDITAGIHADFEQPTINFSDYLVDLSEEIKEPPPLISFGNIPLFTRGNISCISGKAKSRKTFLSCLFSAQFLEIPDNTKIIIFDTEQAKFHVQKHAKRIHRLLEWNENQNDDRLRVFRLRELPSKERLNFIKEAIPHFKPDLIFIDGVRDIMTDFNSIAESTEIVDLLLNLSSVHDCHICAMLHENKNDDNIRGHAGTELQNKSETVISVKKDGDVSAVEPKYCRNIEFEKFYFKINHDGLPELCDPETAPKNTEKLKKLFSEILPENTTLSYAELRDAVMKNCGIKNERGAEKKIKKAIDLNLVVKNQVGHYYLSVPEYLEEETEIDLDI